MNLDPVGSLLDQTRWTGAREHTGRPPTTKVPQSNAGESSPNLGRQLNGRSRSPEAGQRDWDEVLRSVSVLAQAQRTADTTVAQADEYSARVMGEARSMYENARLRAAEMVDPAHHEASRAAETTDLERGDHLSAHAAGRHPHADRDFPRRPPQPSGGRVRPPDDGGRDGGRGGGRVGGLASVRAPARDPAVDPRHPFVELADLAGLPFAQR